jgi:hypothetical protein
VTTERTRSWPELAVADWEATRDTLHLWTQVVGKVRTARAPLVNHWWNVPLYVTSRGLTTSLVPHPTGPSFSIDFDFLASELQIATVEGGTATMTLEPRSVGEFHGLVLGALDRLGVGTGIWPVPVEIPGAVPFADDDVHTAYDPDAARTFWRVLVEITRVFEEFRAGFVGKASPVHFFWGALDLATTRFSGRTAPPHPGGAPNCGPHVMLEAYSHEVSSAGFWPGGPGAEGTFYSYAYPEPDGFRDAPVQPREAHYDADLGEFVLPYEAVRTAADPDAVLLDFLQSTYEAAAGAAGWDRGSLERPG